MSWKNRSDLGTQLVAKVHDQLRIDDSFVADGARGFTYWPDRFALSISSDPANFHNHYAIYRVHADIDVAHAAGRRDQLITPLAKQMSRAALSALCYDAERDMFKLHCSVYGHIDNFAWLSKVLLSAIGFQIAKVGPFSRLLHDEYGLEPATSHHPVAGPRPVPDPFVDAIDKFFLPYGKLTSRWHECDDWKEVYPDVKEAAISADYVDHASITATLPWIADHPIQLSIRADLPHPQYGSGLSFALRVPWGQDSSLLGQHVFSLNDMEREEWNWCHDLGSWSIDEGQLTFNCFLPNIAYTKGCLRDMALDMIQRARWLNETAALKLMGVVTA